MANPILKYKYYDKMVRRIYGEGGRSQQDWEATSLDDRAIILKGLGMILLNNREDAKFFLEVAREAVNDTWDDTK